MIYSKTIIGSLFITSALTIAPLSVSASDDEHHEIKKNIVGVFGGFTSVSGHTNGTIGLEYEHRFNDLLGAGVVFETTPNAHDGDGTSLYMGQVHLHPWQELRLSVGFGKEDIHHEGAHSEDVWRVGAAYDFHVGGFGVAPSLNFDRVGGHTAKVFGISLTKAF